MGFPSSSRTSAPVSIFLTSNPFSTVSSRNCLSKVSNDPPPVIRSSHLLKNSLIGFTAPITAPPPNIPNPSKPTRSSKRLFVFLSRNLLSLPKSDNLPNIPFFFFCFCNKSSCLKVLRVSDFKS